MKVIYKTQQLLGNLVLLLRSLYSRTPDRVRHTVPYISQFANPAWAEMVLADNQPLNKDIMWPQSGANTIAEYEHWALSICGMACAAMAIAFYTGKTYKTIPLAKDATQAGVYTQTDGTISPMQFQPFVKWIRKFGLKGSVYTKLTVRSIQTLLADNALVIASVNPNIRGFNTAPNTQVGGHLVLVTGYNKKDNTITFHNPSGFENNNSQVNHTIPVKEWVIYFSGRGIAVRCN
jgi:hypothetical protein